MVHVFVEIGLIYVVRASIPCAIGTITRWLRACCLWGQWDHMAFVHRIIHGHGEAGVVNQVVRYSDYGVAGELSNWIW